MKALILGAGRGTRLGPVTHKIPKILVPIAGKQLLVRQLEYLERNGVRELAINVHSLADEVLRFLNGLHTPLAIHASIETDLLGTAGALLPLRNFLDEPFVVLYGDVLTNAPLHNLLAAHRRRRALATIVYRRTTDTHGKGVLSLSEDERVTAFAEKPDPRPAEAPTNTGIYAMDPAIINEIPGTSDFGVDVFPRLAARGARLYGHRLDGYAHDVGTQESLAAAAAIVSGASAR